MKRIDPLTKTEFIPKRRNQVFMSEMNRIRWNNEKAAKLRDAKSAIDKILMKNYVILDELLQKGQKKTISKEELLSRGFNLNVFTNLKTYEGATCRCLYNFLFPKNVNPDFVTIIYPAND
jgi:hypothetical protein